MKRPQGKHGDCSYKCTWGGGWFAAPLDYLVILYQENIIEVLWRRTYPDHLCRGTFMPRTCGLAAVLLNQWKHTTCLVMKMTSACPQYSGLNHVPLRITLLLKSINYSYHSIRIKIKNIGRFLYSNHGRSFHLIGISRNCNTNCSVLHHSSLSDLWNQTN